MELKVWCEGIPRVVCGVTEQTTCRDVVIALAQAMGKIGQYTLIEKWRQKERLISPEESPVVALSRWGEYANEVQFILTHSESQHKSNGHSGNRLNVESGWTNKLYGFSSHHGKHFSSSSAIRKSLTFSGAHAHPHIVSNLKMNSNHSENRCSVNGSTYVENMKDDNAEMSQPSRTVTSYDVFEGCIENGQRWQHPSSSSSESALSSLSNKADSLIVGGSLDRSRKCDLSHNNHVPQTSDISRNVTSVHDSMSPLHNSVTSAQSTVTSTLNTQPSLPSSDPSRFGLRVDTTPYNPVTTNLLSSLTTSQIKPMSRESNNNIDYKANANLTGQTRDLITDSLSLSKDICDTEKKRKLELLKLVSDQQERIHKQEQDIEKLEADISLIEHFDHAPKENLNTIQELVRLEKLDNEIDNEIQELELVSWEGKLELELEKEQRLQSEIETMRTSLNKCKTELEKVNSKIKDLEEDVSKEKDLQSIEEKHRKEQEAKVLAEISKLQKQVETKAAEYKNQQKSVEDLFADLKKKEAEIEEKQKKISELEKELKDSNMKLFVRSPGDLIRRSLEGQSLFSRVTRSRPSSAQRLDNLDHLKGGVTLTKTPHGLWV